MPGYSGALLPPNLTQGRSEYMATAPAHCAAGAARERDAQRAAVAHRRAGHALARAQPALHMQNPETNSNVWTSRVVASASPSARAAATAFATDGHFQNPRPTIVSALVASAVACAALERR